MENAKIFVRERRKCDEKGKEPRFRIVAATGSIIKVYADHFRKKELEAIAKAANAELIFLECDHEENSCRGED